jgi:hypothetical protein
LCIFDLIRSFFGYHRTQTIIPFPVKNFPGRKAKIIKEILEIAKLKGNVCESKRIFRFETSSFALKSIKDKANNLERRGARGAVIPLNLLRGYTDPSLL